MENPSFIDDFPIKPSIYRIFSIAMFDYRSVVESWNIICPFLLLYVACIPIHVCYSLSSFCCLWHAGLLYPHFSASAFLQHFSMPPITCCCVVLPNMFGLSTLWLYTHIIHIAYIYSIISYMPQSQPFAWSKKNTFFLHLRFGPGPWGLRRPSVNSAAVVTARSVSFSWPVRWRFWRSPTASNIPGAGGENPSFFMFIPMMKWVWVNTY